MENESLLLEPENEKTKTFLIRFPLLGKEGPSQVENSIHSLTRIHVNDKKEQGEKKSPKVFSASSSRSKKEREAVHQQKDKGRDNKPDGM